MNKFTCSNLPVPALSALAHYLNIRAELEALADQREMLSGKISVINDKMSSLDAQLNKLQDELRYTSFGDIDHGSAHKSSPPGDK